MPPAGLSPRRAVQLTALLTLLVLYLAQLTGALLPNVPIFVAASAAGVLLDLVIQHRQPGLLAVLGKIRFDVVTRQLLRDMLIVVGLVRLPRVNAMEERWLVLLLLGCYAAHFASQAAAVLVRRTRTLPILTRNIDTSGLRLSAAPPRLLARQSSRRLLRFMIPATAGLLATSVPRPTPGHWPAWSPPCCSPSAAPPTSAPGCCPASAPPARRRRWPGWTAGSPTTSRPWACTSPAAPPPPTRRTCGWAPSPPSTATRSSCCASASWCRRSRPRTCRSSASPRSRT